MVFPWAFYGFLMVFSIVFPWPFYGFLCFFFPMHVLSQKKGPKENNQGKTMALPGKTMCLIVAVFSF